MSKATDPKTFSCPKGFTTAVFPDHIELDSIPEDHELILIKAPWNFDVTQLNGHRISLENRNEVEAENKTFLVNMSCTASHLKNIALVLKDSKRNHLFSVAGAFKKQIEISEFYNFPEATIPENTKMPVASPTNIKERFTPYGSATPSVYYKRKFKKVKVKKEVKEPSSPEIVEQFSSPETKRKKKKKKKQEQEHSENLAEQVIDAIEPKQVTDVLEPTRLKKRKKSEALEVSDKKKLKSTFKIKQEALSGDD